MSRNSDTYKTLVENKYQIFNSLFTNLPYEKLSNIGMWIPILFKESEEGLAQGKNPIQIISDFFERHTTFEKDEERFDFLFRIIQYVERQVVLFDSIEDAAFNEINASRDNLDVQRIKRISERQGNYKELIEKINDFGIRIVFTAHPTQFYPPAVQVIMDDLRTAIEDNSIDRIDQLLQQLGKTSFQNKEKPTPHDEALSIMYYLRFVYYDAIGKLYNDIKDTLPLDNPDLVQLGFWPGGDRDGNPFVKAETTRKVADDLRLNILKCYYNELKEIRRRLSFKGVEEKLKQLNDRLYENMFGNKTDLRKADILGYLTTAKTCLVEDHNGLFLDLLDEFITKVQIFGTHFATMDIRQDSSKHDLAMDAIVAKYELADKPFSELGEAEKIKILTEANIEILASDFEDELIADTITNIKQLKTIQELNGEKGCNRYIISNSEDIFAMLNVYGLFRFCGWKEADISMDIIPLFETIKGLSEAEATMNTLYNMPFYQSHLARRGNKQAIMLGFSDGTKDGGYLKANWEIFKTKEVLSKVSDKNDIKVVFFDGRGGPPARGGGKTHRFYASQGKNIANHELQLTIQGQTITSMYGTIDQFNYNCEQLITAGVSNAILKDKTTELSDSSRALMNELGDLSFDKYNALKHHPKFISYLEKMSTLKYYGRAKIGSRPAKRGNKKELTLSDLRAISFVGSWSQLKQNVPGYFGIGSAVNKLKEEGRIDEVKALFENNAFFKSLILNSMMSMTKTNFQLTAYMKEDKEFGEFWEVLYDEFQLSKRMMLEIAGYNTLMEGEPRAKTSIMFREKMVLPLLVIQQYGLQQVAKSGANQEVYEKMVTRSLYGNINASRNSA